MHRVSFRSTPQTGHPGRRQACQQRAHEETHAPLQTGALLYDFGLSEQCRWNINAERLGGLEVDDHLEGRWLLDRQIGGLAPLRTFAA